MAEVGVREEKQGPGTARLGWAGSGGAADLPEAFRPSPWETQNEWMGNWEWGAWPCEAWETRAASPSVS